MINLYNIDDAFEILNYKRKIKYTLLVVSLAVIGAVVFLTSLSRRNIIMIIDIILVSLYLFVVYTYVFCYRKYYNDRYHFLAKIEHFDHEYIEGEIEQIDNDAVTIKNFYVYSLKINARTVYIEEEVFPEIFKLNQSVKLDIVDNFIVGYEVINHEE